MPENDATREEAREYTKTALMRMAKPDLIAVAGEIGVDLAVLPKLTKDAISDAVMVFLEPTQDSKVSDDTEAEEARTFTKSALMRKKKTDLIAVAGEIGVDLAVLPKLTKDAISDAIMVFLEPHLDDGVTVMAPFEPFVNVIPEEIGKQELEELMEREAIPMAEKTSVDPEIPSVIAQGTYQDILRPHTHEKSVRVRRIEELGK